MSLSKTLSETRQPDSREFNKGHRIIWSNVLVWDDSQVARSVNPDLTVSFHGQGYHKTRVKAEHLWASSEVPAAYQSYTTA